MHHNNNNNNDKKRRNKNLWNEYEYFAKCYISQTKFSRPTDTFQAMSQKLEYFKSIEIIMFEKLLRYVGPN